DTERILERIFKYAIDPHVDDWPGFRRWFSFVREFRKASGCSAFHAAEVANFANQLDRIARQLATEFNTHFTVLNPPQFDKRDGVAVILDVHKLDIALFLAGFHNGCRCGLSVVHVKVEMVSLETSDRFKSRMPSTLDALPKQQRSKFSQAAAP